MSGPAVAVQIDYLADHASLVPTIATWQQHAFGHLGATTLAQRIERLEQALQRGRVPVAFVALARDGEPVGAASILTRTITHAHLTPWLSTVVVPAPHRGRGIASALSLRAASEAAAMGFETLYLFTPTSDRLYARLGWTTFETATHADIRLAVMARPARRESALRSVEAGTAPDIC